MADETTITVELTEDEHGLVACGLLYLVGHKDEVQRPEVLMALFRRVLNMDVPWGA